MSTSQSTTRTGAVLLGAMSLLGRCRAFSGALSSGAVVRPLASSASAAARATATATTTTTTTTTAVTTTYGSRRQPLPLSVFFSSATTAGYTANMAGTTRSRGRTPPPLAFAPGMTMSLPSCFSTSARPKASLSSSSGLGGGIGGGRGVGGGRALSAPSRRRSRTSLGMVSDQPFRGPQAEVAEEMDFSSLGLLDDLVDAMQEFGEEGGRGEGRRRE